jgi:hypothetical protein
MRLEYARNLTRLPNRTKRQWTTLRLLVTVFAVLAAIVVLWFITVFVCFSLGIMNPTA